jgi:tetratricopeptide (TPR) repeat protein
MNRVESIRALGTTPIAYSLRQVAEDFGDTPGEKIVILVTDGKEECRGSPGDAVSELQAKGLKVRVNVVGFALAEKAVKEEMRRVAELTGGRFFDARDAKGLLLAIRQAIAVPYEVLDAASTKVASGLTGQGGIQLPEGFFTVIVTAGGKAIAVPDVQVTLNRFTRVEIRKEGQEIGTQVIGPVEEGHARWASRRLAEEQPSEEPQPQQPDTEIKISKEKLRGQPALVLPQEMPKPDLRVRDVQQMLTKLGFDPGPADGFWGNKTEAALVEFQKTKMRRRDPTGQLDDLTFAALKSAAAEGWRRSGALSAKPTEEREKAEEKRSPRNDAIALHNRGVSYANEGDDKKAIQYYSSAIALYDQEAFMYYNRGLSYERLGDKNRAREDFETASRLGHERAKERLEALRSAEVRQPPKREWWLEALRSPEVRQPPKKLDKAPLGLYRAITGTPIRSRPQPDGKIVGLLEKGRTILVVGQAGEYLEVRAGGGPGYVLWKDVSFLGAQ